MKIWIDAQLSPSIAPWIATHFGIEANALRDLGLREATDSQTLFACKRRECGCYDEG